MRSRVLIFAKMHLHVELSLFVRYVLRALKLDFPDADSFPSIVASNCVSKELNNVVYLLWNLMEENPLIHASSLGLRAR